MNNPTSYAIDDNVPVAPARDHPLKYPLRLLEVGQSFFAPTKARSAMGSSISRISRSTKRKFIVRAVTEGGRKGLRVWRVS